MKLSKETVNLFKNFAHINSNILLKAGQEISTISSQKNVMADATVKETFPIDFGIYDLNEFLGAMSLFEDPELDFAPKFVTIKEGNNSIKYFAAESSMLLVPLKKITFPDVDVSFNVTAAMLNMVQRTASVLRATDIQINGTLGGDIVLTVGDKKNATGNSYSTRVGTDSASTFAVNLKVDNLKMLPGDYVVSLSSKKISRFTSTNSDLVYYVAVEADSSFS